MTAHGLKVIDGSSVLSPRAKIKIMRVVKGLSSSLLSALGGVLMVLGEIDDAPGAGGIGIIFIGISIYINLKKDKIQNTD